MKNISLLIVILTLSITWSIAQEQISNDCNYKDPMDLFNGIPNNTSQDFIDLIIKIRTSEWGWEIRKKNRTDRKIRKLILGIETVSNPFIAYLKWDEIQGIPNIRKFYKNNKQLIDSFYNVYVTYGLEKNFLNKFNNEKSSKKRDNIIKKLAFSVWLNTYVVTETFSEFKYFKRDSIKAGYYELEILQRSLPIIFKQLELLDSIGGKDFNKESLFGNRYRLWNIYYVENLNSWFQEIKERDSIYQRRIEISEHNERINKERFKWLEAKRLEKEKFQNYYKQRIKFGDTEHISYKENDDLFLFHAVQGFDVDVANLGISGEVKFYIRGSIENISDEVLTFDLVANGDIYKREQGSIIGFIKVNQVEKYREVKESITIYELQPKEVRPFIIQFDLDRNSQASGHNLGIIGQSIFTLELSDYDIEFAVVDSSKFLKEGFEKEIEKQDKWVKDYLGKEYSQAYETHYSGREIRKYDGKDYFASTLAVWGQSSCIKSLDTHEVVYKCDGEPIPRTVFTVKCKDATRFFYYDEGACILESSKGFHEGNGEKEGAYLGNISIYRVIHTLCGCL